VFFAERAKKKQPGPAEPGTGARAARGAGSEKTGVPNRRGDAGKKKKNDAFLCLGAGGFFSSAMYPGGGKRGGPKVGGGGPQWGGQKMPPAQRAQA